jgi:hypothetical protein
VRLLPIFVHLTYLGIDFVAVCDDEGIEPPAKSHHDAMNRAYTSACAPFGMADQVIISPDREISARRAGNVGTLSTVNVH